MSRVFVGFGFGPIQAGLFLSEAHRCGKFERLVVAEVNPALVQNVRANGGRVSINIAGRDRLVTETIEKIEIYNPADPADQPRLAEALAAASEIATALPSIEFYGRGTPSITSLLARGLEQKLAAGGPPCVVYTGENHNHAAEKLIEGVLNQTKVTAEQAAAQLQTLNTVIGKMSGVIQGTAELEAANLAPMTPASDRAFLVESFNKILISRIELPNFERAIASFIEKPDLLIFEEAKLYGHNATHALLGYLARERGYATMAEAGRDAELMAFGRDAFLEESGAGLLHRHGGKDPLFTPAGFQAYAEDLLERMANPFLQDNVERVVRDPRRKLAWEDRLIGTMRLALADGVRPCRFARGAALAWEMLQREEEHAPHAVNELWPATQVQNPLYRELLELIASAKATA